MNSPTLSPPLVVRSHPLCFEHRPGLGHPETPDRLQVVLDALSTGAQGRWSVDRESPLPGGGKHARRAGLDPRCGPYPACSGGRRARERLARFPGLWGLDRYVRCSSGGGRPRLAGGARSCQRPSQPCILGGPSALASRAPEPGIRLLLLQFDRPRSRGRGPELEPTCGGCGFRRSPWRWHAGDLFGTWRCWVCFDPPLSGISRHRWRRRGRRGAGRGSDPQRAAGGGADDDIVCSAFEGALNEMCGRLRPAAIILSAGFDSHSQDPLGGMAVSGDGFRRLSASAVNAAETWSQGRLLSILEGGFHLEALAKNARIHVEELAKSSTEFPSPE